MPGRARSGSPPSAAGPRRRLLPGLLVALAAVSAAAAVAACGGPAGASGLPSPEKRNLVVEAVPGEGAAGLFIAQHEGLFARQGLHVTIRQVAGSSSGIPALQQGRADVASGAYTSYIAASASGAVRMRIIAAGYSLGPHVQEVVAPSRTGIQSLAGLKGKTIAVNALNGLTTDLLFNALSAYGVTPRQVHLAVLPFPAMPAALAAGRVDAAYEIEPFITEAARLRDGLQVLADIDSGPSQNFPVNGYAVLASWAAKYPRTARAFTAAVEQANAIAATNLRVLQQTYTSQLHLSPQITGVMATGNFPTTADAVQLQRIADMMLRYGQLRHPFSVKSILGA